MPKKKIEPSCDRCEFNFGEVCAGHGTRTEYNDDTYGSTIDEMVKMFPIINPILKTTQEFCSIINNDKPVMLKRTKRKNFTWIY